ncbi:MAG: oligopeptide ABC transporter permease OppB [Neisseriaceae bacterium]|nr:MAG: oligopeptide ABC transporter permease OppB [Neisseriaceae bacterium]
MSKLIIRRILQAIPTLFILIAVSFFIMRMAPGSPFTTEKGYSPEVMHNIAAKYHLDEPLVNQFGYYLKDLLHGDLGPSFKYKDYSVNELLEYALPISVRIGLYAFLLAVSLGFLFGIIAALNQNTWLDYIFMVFAMVGMVIPNFVISPIMVLIFSVFLQLLPPGGWNDGSTVNLILPVIALSLPYIASIAKITRGSMIEVMHSSFIRTARAKGMPMHTIVTRHAMKPALIPVISYLGLALVGIITGSVTVEQIFVLPGMGQLFVNGALNRDYGLIIGLTILVGTLTIIFNTLVDILIGILDPKVKY